MPKEKRPIDQLRALEAVKLRRPQKAKDGPSSPSPPLYIGAGPRGPPTRLQRVLRKWELPAFVGLKKTQIDELMKNGAFPRPIKLSDRAIAWLEDEIVEWQQARIAARDAELREE
jgi:prophage regulatory protein